MDLREITFDDILPIWKDQLWPGRMSPIETHSAMLHLSEIYDMHNFLLPVWYHGIYEDDTLIGVNSGHMCADGTARSRGLWVCPKSRKKGYGKQLLLETIESAKYFKARSAWSFPRKTSWPTYQSAGFLLTSEWKGSETSEANAYCFMDLG